MKRLLSKIEWAVVAILVLFPSVAFAEEGGGIAPHMSWRVIDFVIFCALLYYFLRKPFADFFKNRKNSIVEELKEAERLKDEAEKLLKEAEDKLQSLQDEIKNILETFESMAEGEKQKILKELEKTIERIKASIEEEKSSLISKAKRQLLIQLSKETIDNLRKKFSSLTPEEHAKINEKFIRSLQQ